MVRRKKLTCAIAHERRGIFRNEDMVHDSTVNNDWKDPFKGSLLLTKRARTGTHCVNCYSSLKTFTYSCYSMYLDRSRQYSLLTLQYLITDDVQADVVVTVYFVYSM
jgi:hypothetical protein